ncbi:MAG: SUMF1/EgtB/PvdO family nonheme iron enzyme [Chloroflexota bacterium]
MNNTKFCSIPAASVTVGEGNDARVVAIAGFEIGRYPVTWAEFDVFVDTVTGNSEESLQQQHLHPHQHPHHHLLADHPATQITWHDANAYCRWLSEQTGEHYRLPTEGEWEYAARGHDGRNFPWGDTFHKDYCNNWEGGGGFTTAVDAFAENISPFGVCDMVGNVWEWTASLYDSDDDSDTGDSADAWRTLRGGSWYDTDWGVRASRRFGAPPNSASNNVGFRIVRYQMPKEIGDADKNQ